MKLGEWLEKEKMTQVAFAVLLKSDQGHISDLVTGKVRPTWLTIDLVETVTRGKVTFSDWRTLVVVKPPKKKSKERE